MKKPAAGPHLTFFCELAATELEQLFESPTLIPTLRRLGASVALGLVDLSDERAKVVQRLNREGIPVSAWVLLPEHSGYWLNATNLEAAWARYRGFRAWTDEHLLIFDRIGIDIEPNLHEVRAVRQNPFALLPLLPRVFSSVEATRLAYQGLIDRIRADGYAVDAYVFPFVHNERLVRTSALQRITGMLDLHADREVCMLYSSFARPYGHALLELYAPHFQSIAVGVTGGGVEEGLDPPPDMSWEEFARDLRIAARHTRELYVFSLEGCVENGYLQRLSSFDYGEPVHIDPAMLREAEAWIRRINRVLRVLRQPRVALLIGAAATALPGIALSLGVRHLRRKKRAAERARHLARWSIR